MIRSKLTIAIAAIAFAATPALVSSQAYAEGGKGGLSAESGVKGGETGGKGGKSAETRKSGN